MYRCKHILGTALCCLKYILYRLCIRGPIPNACIGKPAFLWVYTSRPEPYQNNITTHFSLLFKTFFGHGYIPSMGRGAGAPLALPHPLLGFAHDYCLLYQCVYHSTILQVLEVETFTVLTSFNPLTGFDNKAWRDWRLKSDCSVFGE